MPLEGEWTWCASGKVSNSKGNANVFNTAIEHTDGSDKSTETVNTKDIESEGCEGSMDERASIDDMDGGTGREVQPTDTPNKPEKLVTLSIKLEDPHNGEIPHVHLRGMNWRACNTEGLGSQTDASTVHMDACSVKMETETPVNEMESISMCQTDVQMLNSPYKPEIVMAKPISRWRKVSDGNVEVYVPWNMPVEALV